MWHGPKVVASEPWTVLRGFSVPFGRSVITYHTPPVPHGPRTNSMQITPKYWLYSTDQRVFPVGADSGGVVKVLAFFCA